MSCFYLRISSIRFLGSANLILLLFIIGLQLLTSSAFAAERKIKFHSDQADKTPPGFRSTVSGVGGVGRWEVVMDDVPSNFAAITQNATSSTRQSVLAQKSRDVTDEHFPLLILEDEIYGDFTLRAKLKTVGGAIERMAGIAFRIKDEKNYYVVRISSIGNTLRFYKFVDGVRSPPVGPNIEISSGEWHDLKISCRGNQINIALNGRHFIPEITDTSFTKGYVGFWTKSDSVSYFGNVTLNYDVREPLAQSLVKEMMKKYDRVIGMTLFAKTSGTPALHVIASSAPEKLGDLGRKVEIDVYERAVQYHGKVNKNSLVTLPLKDRNGDVIAAVRFEIKHFPGQMAKVAIARVFPIIQDMERRAFRTDDLTK